MTSERDFDRLARAWLELGPDEVPDRVVAAVLQAAETTPQVRRPISWPFRRFIPMTRIQLVAGMAAILVVLVGGGILLSRWNPSGPGVTSPSPTTRPLASSAPIPLPEAVRGTWLGGHRDLPGISPTAGAAIFISDMSFALSQVNELSNPVLTASAVATDVAAFRLTGQSGCQETDAGEYTWQISTTGRTLTITAVSDPCASRLAAIPGEWLKSGCSSAQFVCLGDLEGGTIASQFVDPRVKPGDPWVPNYGAVQVTVPAGWTNLEDYPGDYSLEASTSEAGSVFGAGFDIWIWTQPAAADPTVNCFAPVAGGPLTVDGLIGHLQTSTALMSSNVQDVTIAGHAGKSLDIALDPTWSGTCEGAGGATNVLVQSGSNSQWVFGLVAGARDRVILLDLGRNDVMLISIESVDGSTFDAFMAEAMPVVESLTFE